MKTIKQLADDLGVSKTAIRKYLTPDFRASFTQTLSGNVIAICPEGCKLIAESLRKPLETDRKPIAETTGNQVSADVIAVLTAQLAAKDAQIASLQAQNEQLTTALQNTTDSLKAAQALHAGTMQKMLPEETPEPERRHWWQRKK